MKLKEFEQLCPSCIVCGKPMHRTFVRAYYKEDDVVGYFSTQEDKKYTVELCCSRTKRCSGLVSNVVGKIDPIVLSKFYMNFPEYGIVGFVDSHTEITVRGKTYKVAYIPFDIWYKSRGQIKEKIMKLLPLMDPNAR